MSTPEDIKPLADAMLSGETLEQAACRFLMQRDNHRQARTALEESEEEYRLHNEELSDLCKRLQAERDRLKGETMLLKREVRRLSQAVENKVLEVRGLKAEIVGHEWSEEGIEAMVSELKRRQKRIANSATHGSTGEKSGHP